MSKQSWEEFVKGFVDEQTQNRVLNSVIRNTSVQEFTEREIVLGCDSHGAKIYLDGKIEELENAFSYYVKRPIKLRFVVVAKKSTAAAPLLDFEPSKQDVFKKAGLNYTCTFENFAVSSSNQVAFAAAQAVAQNPTTSYNPLFLYGGVGVGKTHLAQAVAHALIDKNPDTHVLFCSSEKFMNDLIESIREKNTIKFRKRYRSLGLIIVDDIQFIAGKQTVQEEFFHTFNSVVSGGGQVILTSDRPPFEIRNLEDRLRSRFSGGLIVDIQQPDFELRTAILLIKAKEKNIDIDIEAAKAVAESINDARSLEGMLLSLYARSLSVGRGIDLLMVEELVKDRSGIKDKKMNPQDIIKTVCSYYDIKQSHIKGDSRKSSIALARQVVMYLLRHELGLNLDEVAYMVKRKDHTTVMHGCAKVQQLLMKDVEFKKEVDIIVQTIRSST